MAVSLRAPSALDVRRTFHWLQDDKLRSLFLMKSKPDRAGHFAYWRRMINSEEQKVFSVYDGKIHVGNAGIKNIDLENQCAELWLYIGDTKYREGGIGTRILGQLEYYIANSLRCGTVFLHVSKDNNPALNLYRKFGYRASDENCAIGSDFSNSASVLRMEKSL
jgi:RimJ/RimL family protein N-acetyltransferase